MTPGEALGVAVQVAVALAGFTGVVAVFGTNPVHEWSPLNRLRVRLLLTMSSIPVALCLLAVVLLTTGLYETVIWRSVSAVAALAFLMATVMAQRGMSRVPASELNRSDGSRSTFYTTGAVGAAAILLLIYNVFLLGAFWPLLTAVVVAMMAALLQFVRLVFLRPGGTAK
ncbi:MAG TPA: hypothetical protein VKR31_03375 [Rhizomicrobium sp.]|nr:hypothetical protein [Rhizomicrobium sp.]